jgi:hypothetical protein
MLLKKKWVIAECSAITHFFSIYKFYNQLEIKFLYQKGTPQYKTAF